MDAPTDHTRPPRRLDRKLAHIQQGRYTASDFVLADAKDADMAFGLAAAGLLPDAEAGVGPGRHRTRETYLNAMRSLVEQDVVDILLTSASNGERLSHDSSLGTSVTLAIRANDSSDIWNHRNGAYASRPSRPFRTAVLSAVQPFCDLVLYSVTFNNDLDADLATLEAYNAFREEAAQLGIRHFLEVFNPNAVEMTREQVGPFVNDSIVRSLAGVTSAQRPMFLKMAYNGAAALAELVEHDPSMVVGILGGAAGTTRDTFELLHRAQAGGGRVALFGRKIQQAESQLDLVALMPSVLSGELNPAAAVRAYHDRLRAADCPPRRALEDDLQVTDPALLAE